MGRCPPEGVSPPPIPMKDPMKIRRLKKSEIPEVKRLCESAHWPYTLKDVERLYRLGPGGWFCAIVDRQFAGQAMGLKIENLGCIGIVIVREDLRRRGIATALTETALKHLLDQGIKTVKLDATPEGYGIYKKLRFVPEFSVFHYAREASLSLSSGDASGGIEALRSADMTLLAKMDKRYYGVDRSTVLRALAKDSEGYVLSDKKKIRGYAMTRPMDYENGLWLGPWVAEDSSTAEALLKQILSRSRGKEIRLGAVEANIGNQDLLARYGFKADFKITRMCYGRPMKRGNPSGIYAEAGHEKG
jgi:ribosomal protein S18 acetylase RimI-like enzyme